MGNQASAGLSSSHRQEIEKLIEQHGITRRLSSGQRWDVALILGAFVIGATAVLGLGAAFIVEQTARSAAKEYATTILAQEIVQDPDSLKILTGATVAIPQNAVVAFNRQCPAGWELFRDAAGRMIVGVGQGDGLRNRGLEERGGAETHTLTIAEMPRHSHEGGGTNHKRDGSRLALESSVNKRL